MTVHFRSIFELVPLKNALKKWTIDRRWSRIIFKKKKYSNPKNVIKNNFDCFIFDKKNQAHKSVLFRE